MAQPIAPDYGQQFLLPPALEDWVPADHPARFLREFVDQLNLPEVGFTVPAAVEGRPPYHPSLLLKIWLYGYFHGIRSTRKLETACHEHLSLLWLTGLIQPDHNTLWRFWRDNKKALRRLFKQTVQLAVRTGATGLVLQALDGTKIEAAASGYSGWSKEYMEKLMVQLDAALDGIELQVVAENAATEQTSGYRLPAWSGTSSNGSFPPKNWPKWTFFSPSARWPVRRWGRAVLLRRRDFPSSVPTRDETSVERSEALHASKKQRSLAWSS